MQITFAVKYNLRMNLQHRIDLLAALVNIFYPTTKSGMLQKKASQQNGWFIPEFIDLAVTNIAHNFLKKDLLENGQSNMK